MAFDEPIKEPDAAAGSETAEGEAWAPAAPEAVVAPEAPDPVVIAGGLASRMDQSHIYEAELERVQAGVAAELRRMKAAPAGTPPLEAVEQEEEPAVREPAAKRREPAERPSFARRILRGLLIAWIALFLVMLIGSGVYAAVRGDWRDVTYVIVATFLFAGIILGDRRRKRAREEAPQPVAEEEAPHPVIEDAAARRARRG